MSDYPRLDPNGLLYYSQQIKQKIADSLPTDMTGATASANGAHGLVPQPNAGQENMFLKGSGAWGTPPNATTSANGYMSSTDKTKLDGVEDDAQENTIESISVNGDPVTPDANKNVEITIPDAPVQSVSVNSTPVTPDAQGNVDIEVPTATSDLTNDSDFQTEAEVQQLIDDALADITGIEFEIVQTLPQTGEKGVFYLVPIEGTTNNIYDEYVWVRVGGTAAEPVYGFEKIGTTQVDLSGYVQATEMTTISNAIIDTIIQNAWS